MIEGRQTDENDHRHDALVGLASFRSRSGLTAKGVTARVARQAIQHAAGWPTASANAGGRCVRLQRTGSNQGTDVGRPGAYGRRDRKQGQSLEEDTLVAIQVGQSARRDQQGGVQHRVSVEGP